ncbi:hypothetical protein N9K87_04400 [Flavobacteriaceae bacterium]|jgi:hypothetical protein|nr:hypothetical protein [Flavobacteriaceae bacterium]
MTNLDKLKQLDDETLGFFKTLESLPKNKLSFSDNKWSVLQILYHVWLAEVSSEKYIRTKIQYPETIIKTPVLAYIRAFLTKYFLLLGISINAPKHTTKFPEKISLKKLQENWINSRASFSKLILELDQKNLSNKAVFRHPIMGRINLSLTLYFFKLHFNHHQKQINKRINSFT